MLMQLFDAMDDDAVKVKCIGTLECLAQHPTSVDANRVRLLSLYPPIILRLQSNLPPATQVITQYLISLLPTPTTPHPTSVHAPKPLKQVPPFLSAPRPDEPPPAAPPPIVIPQPPILQAALMAVPEHPAAPVPGASEQGQWHGAQAGLDAFVAYSAQELFGGYVAYEYVSSVLHPLCACMC